MSLATEEYSHFFAVKLPLFDGPIDLLLHLVKSRELPIERVSLAEVTEQYMRCLDAMRKIDLEIAGEYLLIAATLVSIKSAIMLDQPVELVPDDEGNMIDPHEELLRRLREAEVFKDSAELLGSRDLLGYEVFAPASGMRSVKAPPVKYLEHDPLLLGKAFRELLDRVGPANEYVISLESVSIVDRMMQIMGQLEDVVGSIEFWKLIPNVRSRAEVIGTFLSLLELCKRGAIRVYQEDYRDTVMIERATQGIVNTNELESEFDQPQNESVEGIFDKEVGNG